MIKHKNPLITIVISTKNEEKNLPRLLKSIKKQDFSDYEIIVVDNHSTDQSVNMAKKYTKKVYRKGPERSTQRNYAAQKSRGRYLFILDADMELNETVLSTCLKECQEGNYAALSIPEENPQPNYWAQCRNLEKKLAHGESLLSAARFIRKDFFHKVEGYDENLIAAEDYDLDDRLGKAGANIGISTQNLQHHENPNLMQIVRKKFYYGKLLHKYVVKNRKTALKRFNPLRPVYLRKISLLIFSPHLALGLLILKLIDYFAGGLGIITVQLQQSERRNG